MTAPIKTVSQIKKLRKQVALWREQKQKIAFVPTMGALHDGHLSLIKQAQKTADKVIVSIFVNPTQFGVGEDLSSYPRPLDADKAKLISLNTDLLYTPTSEEMYPANFSTTIHLDGLTSFLCGGTRPTHFDGVALVVTKLLLQVMPDIALFGQKDYQQLMIIKKLVRELDIPVQIDSVPIFREADGLAMSSRNIYLDKVQRAAAPALYQTLMKARTQFKEQDAIEDIIMQAKCALTQQGFKLDYLELRDNETLAEITAPHLNQPARLFAAVYLGKTRLIDNIEIS